jgi:hypothetical protein
MSKYIQKVERCSFLISRSVKCVTRTTKVDNFFLPEPEIISFITRFFIQLSRLIDLLTWTPSYLVYSNWHDSALNYNIYLLNSSKVKKICINRNYYDLYILSLKSIEQSLKVVFVHFCLCCYFCLSFLFKKICFCVFIF